MESPGRLDIKPGSGRGCQRPPQSTGTDVKPLNGVLNDLSYASYSHSEGSIAPFAVS